MASECCFSLTKYFLFLFNLIFFILGLLLLSLGLWMQFSEASFFIYPTPYISNSLFSNLLIISGSVTMLLGFLGCLGSLKAVKCLLGTYFILLMVLLAAQIVGGVLLYTQKTELDKSLQVQTLKLIEEFGRNQSSLKDLEQTLEYIQQEGKCCGWYGKVDWGSGVVPCSCSYIISDVNTTYESHAQEICPRCYSNDSISNHTCGIYEQGCSENIQKWLDENILFILLVILAIAVVEICGMTLSMCLYKESSVEYSPFPY
ncbi:leukocyte antigen CD37 [Triplophysa dalaica]|uniref:leukocyte antigen CD37 n=1 Tax=Triplophysa dalaica TaxID=1582913 RepID=UPI0024E02A0F|nr:leukocyte antigen CD37 [Triplophysa dalaica]XP_056626455.1 leukocyte antigen CD37 [Triplophysa dalaica]